MVVKVISRKTSTQVIKILRDTVIAGSRVKAGDTVETDDWRYVVGCGKAEVVEKPKKKRTAKKPAEADEPGDAPAGDSDDELGEAGQ